MPRRLAACRRSRRSRYSGAADRTGLRNIAQSSATSQAPQHRRPRNIAGPATSQAPQHRTGLRNVAQGSATSLLRPRSAPVLVSNEASRPSPNSLGAAHAVFWLNVSSPTPGHRCRRSFVPLSARCRWPNSSRPQLIEAPTHRGPNSSRPQLIEAPTHRGSDASSQMCGMVASCDVAARYGIRVRRGRGA
jgi:hypothetical protein